jgi:hypothetical protein
VAIDLAFALSLCSQRLYKLRQPEPIHAVKVVCEALIQQVIIVAITSLRPSDCSGCAALSGRSKGGFGLQLAQL